MDKVKWVATRSFYNGLDELAKAWIRMRRDRLFWELKK